MTTETSPADDKLKLYPVDPHDLGVVLDNRTVLLRYADAELSRWPTTQAWRWEGGVQNSGDAICVEVHGKRWFVVRRGDEFRTVQTASVKNAMARVGLNPFCIELAKR
jgi:hypothetical protein